MDARRGLGVWVAAVLLAGRAWGADYYVDAAADGGDARDGTSEANAWQSLAPVASAAFAPGDVVHFKRGGSWDAASLGTNGLVLDASGTEAAPITFTSYGAGALPRITNSNSSSTWIRAVTVTGQWLVLEQLHLLDAAEASLTLEQTSGHVWVRDCEASGSGNGIIVRAEHNLITGSNLHDFVMVRNTPGGDDDYGAVAVQLMASNNEVAYNRMERCVAPSYDYEQDGGGIEIYAETAATEIANLLVHHNWVADGEGFFEIGGQGGTVRDLVFHHNVLVHNRVLAVFHNGGTNFTVTISGVRFEQNTVVEPDADGGTLLWSASPMTSDTLSFVNNVVALGAGFDRVFNADGFTHDHNLYAFAGPGTVPGVTLGEGELTGDAAFVDAAARDFHLRAGSAAIDAGAPLEYPLDFDDRAVPAGAAPDLGAYEYGATGTAGSGGDGGAPVGSGGTLAGGAPSGTGGSGLAPGSGGTVGAPTGGDEGGCGCAVPTRAPAAGPLALGLLLLGLGWRRAAVPRRAKRAAGRGPGQSRPGPGCGFPRDPSATG